MYSAYQYALDSAIMRVSEARLAGPLAAAPQDLATRIEDALRELDKLKNKDIPDYSNPDVALLYSHWYLPAQVNLAYSLSAKCLSERARSGPARRPIQLVDFGAGSGAMVLGLILALARHLSPDQWPEMIAVYQIDLDAMLDLGDEIWSSLAIAASASKGLPDIAEIMSRTLFERTDARIEVTGVDEWTGAERWLTALHVVYEDRMEDTKHVFRRLQDTVRPHFTVVTAPKSKEARIKNPEPVRQRLKGTAGAMMAHRARLAQDLDGRLGQKARDYLTNEVQWAAQGQNKVPIANLSVHLRGDDQ